MTHTINLITWVVIVISLEYSVVPASGITSTRHKLKFGHRPDLNICYKNFSPSESNTALRCYHLNHPFCLDIELPYRAVALPEYVPDLKITTIEEVQIYLQRWQSVKKLPKCWSILQATLCSIFMPQCDEDPETRKLVRISRPSYDVCNDLVNKEDCRFLGRHFDWPNLFNCNDTSLYSKNCTSELRDPKLQSAAPICQYPLVATNDSTAWFSDIPGCALSCKFPISDANELYNINLLKQVLCLTGLLSTLVAILLFKTNEEKALKSQIVKVVKRYNICQFVFYLGWSLQIFTATDIACAPDGTNQNGLPLVANWCVLSFILTYLPSLCSVFYFAHLGKLCHERLQGKEKKSLRRKVGVDSTINSFIYLTPVILFVGVTFLGHIDGRGLHGICTIGQQSILIKTVFVFIPTLVGVLYGSFYFAQTVYRLVNADNMKPSLRRYSARITTLATLSLLQVLSSIGIYFYEFKYRSTWSAALDNYVACGINLKAELDTETVYKRQDCSLESKPIAALYYLELIATLSVGIVIASWAMYDSNFRGMRNKFIDLLEDDKDRKRRALNFFKEMDAHNREAILFEPAVREDLQSKHYLLDLPTGTPQNLDLNERDRATPSSLASTNLPPNLGNNQYLSRRNSRVLGHSMPTARDVVESARHQVNPDINSAAFAAPTPSGIPILPPNLLNQLYQQMMLQTFNQTYSTMKINPEFLDSQTEAESEHRFLHGLCDGKE